MFEQSYTNHIPAETVKEGDFLYNYEIRSWQLTPRLYKILAASAVVNLAFIAILAQTSILTAKGCDSPLVGRVCQVLDTVYVGAMLFGTEREYADAAYDPTRLEPDDEITFVDVSNLEAKLEYPSSFQDFTTGQEVPMFGQPDAALTYQTDPGFVAPGIPSNPTTSIPDLVNTPQVLPTPNADAVQGQLPSSIDSTPSTPLQANRKGRRGRLKPQEETTASADSNSNTTENPTVPNTNANTTPPQDEATADRNGVFINKRPLTDQAKETLAQLPNIRLDTPFKVTLEGTLGLAKDGKTVVLKNPRPVKDPAVKNDPVMEKLVTDWILRVGDSGWLGYLNTLDQKNKIKSRKVSITVEQNAADFLASVRSEMPSENEARSASSGLALLMEVGAKTTEGDEQLFLNSATTGFDKNLLVFNFKMPTADVQQLIQRKLADLQKSVNQPNSTAVIRSGSNTAGR